MSDEQHIEENAASDSVKMSKIDIIGQVVRALDGMTINDLSAWHENAIKTSKAYASTVGDFAAKAKASVEMKGTAKGAVKEEAEKLFGEMQELPEDFRFKAVTLFESAVAMRTAVEVTEIREELEQKFEEDLAALHTELVERTEKYLDSIASSWLEENQVAIASQVRLEHAEKLIDSLRGVLVQFNVELPEEKVDLLSAAEERIAELEDRLNDSMNESIQLSEDIMRREALEVFEKVTDGLALTQVEEFKKIVEDVDVDDKLEETLIVLRDAHFGKKQDVQEGTAQKVAKEIVGEEVVVIVEDNPGPKTAPKEISENMKPYIDRMKQLIR